MIQVITYLSLCCNMFVFACPIIAGSSVGYLPSGPISIFALKYPYWPPNATSVSVQWCQTLLTCMSKCKERWCIKIGIVFQ
jgi:hypothetical protein